MHDNITIRQAKEEDAQQLVDIFQSSVKQLCANDYPADVILKWSSLGDENTFKPAVLKGNVWVAEQECKILGFVDTLPGEIMNLFISPDHIGKGIGYKLGKLGITRALAGSNGSLYLESTLTAASFYEKLGFKRIGDGFYSHGSTDLKIKIIKMEYVA